jgi:hypothetical protein
MIYFIDERRVEHIFIMPLTITAMLRYIWALRGYLARRQMIANKTILRLYTRRERNCCAAACQERAMLITFQAFELSPGVITDEARTRNDAPAGHSDADDAHAGHTITFSASRREHAALPFPSRRSQPSRQKNAAITPLATRLLRPDASTVTAGLYLPRRRCRAACSIRISISHRAGFPM